MSKAKDFLKEKMREDFKLIGDVDEKILKNTNLREKYLAPHLNNKFVDNSDEVIRSSTN